MLRIVYMGDHTSRQGDFAVWNTVTDRFLEDDLGDQTWMCYEELEENSCSISPTHLERIKRLLDGMKTQT